MVAAAAVGAAAAAAAAAARRRPTRSHWEPAAAGESAGRRGPGESESESLCETYYTMVRIDPQGGTARSMTRILTGMPGPVPRHIVAAAAGPGADDSADAAGAAAAPAAAAAAGELNRRRQSVSDGHGGHDSEHATVDDGQPEPGEADWELEDEEPGVLYCIQYCTNIVILYRLYMFVIKLYMFVI